MTLFYRSSNIYRAVFSLSLFFSCSSLSRCEITTLLSAFTFLFYSLSWIFYCFSPLFSYLKLAMILFCSSIFYNATLNCCFKSAIFSTISSILISFWSILSLSSRIVPSYLPFSFSQYILSFSYSISRNFAFSSRILMSLWLLVRKF